MIRFRKKKKVEVPHKKVDFKLYFKRYWQLYLLLVIPLIYLLVFKYSPMYYVMIAFKKYSIVQNVS